MSSPSSSPLSSPLSSVASRSPSPPADYPSPPSTNISEPTSSPRVRTRDVTDDDTLDGNGPPPAKRQRIMKSKELSRTDYLNLQLLSESNDETDHLAQEDKIKKLRHVLRNKKKIVVIAGAGISVSAGIPDFRSSKGLFSTLRNTHKLKSSGKHLFDADVYRNDASTSSFHTMVRELSHLTQNAKPTPFHDMLATIAEEGRLLRLYTQNVDGIDTALPPLATNVPLNLKGPWPRAIQLHGGLGKMVCSKCSSLLDFDGALFEGPEAPPCPECEIVEVVREASGLRGHGVGRLRPRMVLYNEHNPDEDAIGAVTAADLKARPDAVIVVGTSLKIPGVRRIVKEMCPKTRQKRGGFTAWINFDPEPTGVEFKDCWDMVVRGACDEVANLVDLPKWHDKDPGEYVTMQNGPGNEEITRLEIVVDQKPITAIKTQGMITPTDSPRELSPTSAAAAKPSKLKQSQLQFGGSALPSAAVEKPKSKAGRKPLPGSKASKAPANKITNTFGASKATKNPVGRPKKIVSDGGALSGLPPSSPDVLVSAPWVMTSKPTASIMEVVIPHKVYDRMETVSPTSKPRGMGNLIE